jgi:Class III cytochrome C family
MGSKGVWAALFLGFLVLVMLIAIRIDPSFHVKGSLAVAAAEKSTKSKSSPDLDVIIINNKEYKSKRRGPVSFSHLKHAKDYNISCWQCHHEYDDSVNVWVPWSGDTPGCADCHEPGKGEDKMPGLQKAYHLLCRDCHKTLQEQHKKTGPYRGCLECHEKGK